MRKTHSCSASMVLVSVVLMVWSAAVGAIDIHVSPEGKDGWSGKLARPNTDRSDGPVGSLTGARDAVRRIKRGGPLTEPVRIVVADGEYALTEPLTLQPTASRNRASASMPTPPMPTK